MKPWTEARNNKYIWNVTLNLHTNSHFEMWAEKWTIKQEATEVVHPRPQTPQGESVAKAETPLLIM